MFDCQAFLEQVYKDAFSPPIVNGRITIEGSTNGTFIPVTGNIFHQDITKTDCPLITWVQAGAVYDESVDAARDSIDFDVSISVRRPKVLANKMDPDPPLSRVLNAAEYALAVMVDCDPSVTMNTAEPDENTINEFRYARAFTLTVEGPVAYDGVLMDVDNEDSPDYDLHQKLFRKQ